MGCFGGNSDGFGGIGIIILLFFLLCFCNNGSGIFSDLFEDCGLVWIAIILLLLFLCNNDNCNDNC